MKQSHIIIVAFAATLILAGCAGPAIFPSIGAEMSNPITLAIDSANARLYINNSNYRVLYGDGSLHVVNITDPANMTRVNYLDTPSFNGEFYLDTTALNIYTPNRYSDGDADVVDNLFRINVDESSADFLARADFASGDDPYGIACCDAENRLLTATISGYLDYYDLDSADLTHGALDLTVTLDNGVELEGASSTRVVIIGTQAVVTRANGGLLVINLAQLGVSGAYPVDYVISDIDYPRGIATDGTYIYVTNIEIVDNTRYSKFYVLDISSLTPRTDNTSTHIVYKDGNTEAGEPSLVVAPSPVSLGYTNSEDVVLEYANNSTETAPPLNAYITDFTADVVTVVELAGYTKTTDIPVGEEPYGMAVYYDPSGSGAATHLFVTNSNSNTVSAVELAGNTIVGTYP